MIELNKVYNQDTIELMKKMPDESVDLIFSDPPFNLDIKYNKYKDKREDYYEWCAEWIKEGFRILKPNGSFYLMTVQQHLGFKLNEMSEHGFLKNVIIWKNTSLPRKDKYTISYQPILYFTKSEKGCTYHHDADSKLYEGTLPWGRKPKGSTMKDLWDDIPFIAAGCMASKEAILYPGTKKKYHKCQMPLALAHRIILASSNENDIVFDMFSGSGTFVTKAKELNRQFVGSEIDQEYIDEIIEQRLSVN